MYTHKGETLYLAEDRTTVVKEDDPRARYVLIADGAQMSDEDAATYGLTGEKAKPEQPNKAKVAAENKGK